MAIKLQNQYFQHLIFNWFFMITSLVIMVFFWCSYLFEDSGLLGYSISELIIFGGNFFIFLIVVIAIRAIIYRIKNSNIIMTLPKVVNND